ncbi:bacillithiol system redox-active protein YtxJ [Flavobacterium sp.]|uniref:bacillithiol system redox-active protein YtxJ n=1 Tax=Flavobacterium sp. TaxID=239 RepID=UPI002489E61B|nr:bacillithiol system redox-active protein YtxJ [Flavobacterium sp.]MDI1317803.1 bacillithiol system redox-active protein YtxJ [Flavobacterium sp.]
MSIFEKLFGGENSKQMPDVFWNYLEDIAELEAIKIESFEKPVAIFKHSITCGISKMAWNQFQKNYNISKDQMSLYYLDLLARRSISNEIASRFGVVHQSPQLIVIKDGKAIYHSSHENINATDLERFI